jgi:hypothetical protein
MKHNLDNNYTVTRLLLCLDHLFQTRTSNRQLISQNACVKHRSVKHRNLRDYDPGSLRY